ncbi:MAG: chalcone isomerase family protein [Pseudomonadota bacterium]
MRFATLCTVLLFACGAARAESLTLVGEASLRVLFWDIYNSRLYTETGSYERYQRPLRLEIEYQRDIPSDALVDRTGTEWDAQGLDHENQAAWLARLRELWPDVQQGDRLALELGEDNRSYFTLNGETLGAVDDTDFGQHFVDIWLSPRTTRPELRTALIGYEEASAP